MLRPMSKPDTEILESLFSDMKEGTYKKIDNSTCFMPLSVERLSDNSFSMAHYFTNNGDLVPDPDVELIRATSGKWYPVALQQSTGNYTRAISEIDADGNPVKGYPRKYNEIRSFLSMWLKNLKYQQNL